MKILNFFLKKIFSGYFNRKIFTSGCSHFSLMKKNYNDIKDLSDLEFKVFSQNGEDGIIDYLLYSLNIKKPKFIEIGTGDYSESNTRFLFERTNCKGLIVDCIKNLKKKVSRNTKLWKGDLTIVEEFVDSENVTKILKDNNFFEGIDLFSLDIDGIDYWVLESLPEKFSKIFVVEYNATFGPNVEITVPKIKNFERKKYHHSNLCFGASLKAIVKLMNKKKYFFLGTNITCNNAFFILEDEVKRLNINLPKNDDLTKYTNSNIRESRSIEGKLTYLSGDQKIKEIENCEIVDLSNPKREIKKIKDV